MRAAMLFDGLILMTHAFIPLITSFQLHITIFMTITDFAVNYCGDFIVQIICANLVLLGVNATTLAKNSNEELVLRDNMPSFDGIFLSQLLTFFVCNFSMVSCAIYMGRHLVLHHDLKHQNWQLQNFVSNIKEGIVSVHGIDNEIT